MRIRVALCALAAVLVARTQALTVSWEFPRTGSCHEGLPFSDGVTGVLVWGGGDTVNLTVGRADLWDHRGGYDWEPSQSYSNIVALVRAGRKDGLLELFKKESPPNWGGRCNPYLLPLGRVVVRIPGATVASGELDTSTGLGRLFLSDGRTVDLAMSKADRVFALRTPKGLNAVLDIKPATDFPVYEQTLKGRGFEKARRTAEGFTWRLPADEPVSLVCERLSDADGETLSVRTWRGEPGAALRSVPASFADVAAESAARWRKFWREGARVEVPDPVLQRIFDYGMYRFGAMTDPDGVPAGLQGPWLEDDRLVPWNGDYHFNINVQECYSPAFRGGHFDHLRPLFRMVLGWRPRLRENARRFCGIEDGYAMPHSVDDRGVCIGGFWSGTIDHGSTAWMAALMYRYVSYSGDRAMLKDGIYDFMRGAMNVYRAMMEEYDGRLSLPVGPSPEWGGSDPAHCVGRDPSFQLAAAHRLAADLIEAAGLLGEAPDPMWLDVRKRLPRYTAKEGVGLQLFEGVSLTESHRHHSHLAGYYPFDVIGLAENPQLAFESRRNWMAQGTGQWSGWCVPWASILYTHFGDASAAVHMLQSWDRFFCNPGHGSLHNAYRPGFTAMTSEVAFATPVTGQIMQMDGQCAAATAVLELLVHEVNGKLEFFRGCPPEWKDVRFENVAVRGGRRISGRRVNGVVTVEDVVPYPVAAYDGVTSGYEQWAGIPAHPAVVNPVCGQDPEQVISLRGKWFFREAKYANLRHPLECDLVFRTNRMGLVNFGRGPSGREPLPMRELEVPGVWEAQGVGEPNQESVPWECDWDCNRMTLRNSHRGEGWYGKYVRLPSGWRDRRIWLKLGGVRAQALVWVNGHQVAWNDCYCGTYKYEITPFVRFGGEENYITLQVSNRSTSRKGDSEEMNRWGGIHRDIEIEATPQTFIDDAWVRGDYDRQEAEVHVDVEGDRNRRLALRVEVDGAVVEQGVQPEKSQRLRIPLRNFRAWSPEHPNLYTAKVSLVENGFAVHRRLERFGVRKLEVRGKDLYLNDRPFFLRGFGQCYYYPLTGSSPADRRYHLDRLLKARAAGFNAVRLHTHCENPEYFEAADEAGILVQPELPYYNSVPCGGGSFDPERDLVELCRHFRRYPSFAVYSMGNEGTFGKHLDRKLHQLAKQMDPDRLAICQDTYRPPLCEADVSDIVGGPLGPWKRGYLGSPDRPCIAHEYLNLCVKTDSRLADRFTGVIVTPLTRERRAAWLSRFGLSHLWGDRLQDAQHALQRDYQKSGIESARIDPDCDGYHFWTLADVTVAVPENDTFSAQGLFDIFWNPKINGTTPAEFARFNSPEAILADLSVEDRIRTSGDRLTVDFFFAHYGEAPYAEAPLRWTLSSEREKLTFGSGVETVRQVGLGPVRKVATVELTLPEVRRPTCLKLNAALGKAENAWDIWLFPKRAVRKPIKGVAAGSSGMFGRLEEIYDGVLPPERKAEAKVVVVEDGSPEITSALARGQKVLSIGAADGEPNVSLGWWFMGRQVGTAFLDHPALSGLPHDGHLSPMFGRIVKAGRALPVPGIGERDMIAVGEGGSSCCLHVAQKGNWLMVYGLDVFAPCPEARSLLDGLIGGLLK